MTIETLGTERPDRLEGACAMFAVHAPGEDAAPMTVFGPPALRRRGQENGIPYGDGTDTQDQLISANLTRCWGAESISG